MSPTANGGTRSSLPEDALANLTSSTSQSNRLQLLPKLGTRACTGRRASPEKSRGPRGADPHPPRRNPASGKGQRRVPEWPRALSRISRSIVAPLYGFSARAVRRRRKKLPRAPRNSRGSSRARPREAEQVRAFSRGNYMVRRRPSAAMEHL